jgi:transcription antitermination factor NusG
MSSVNVTATGIVEEWPVGLTANLPTDHWLVLHAFPRQDKKLIEALRAKRLPGCAFFERRIRHYPGKGKQESLVPLLGGYVFVAVPAERKQELYDTRRVVRILDVPQPKLFAADVMALCQLVRAVAAPLVVRPELVPGARVTVTKGTLAGCSGVIVRRQNQVDLIVNMDLLGQSVSVSLPAECAEEIA